MGSLAAAIGTAVWYAIGKLTGYEFGLIAILIGLLVGGAVLVAALSALLLLPAHPPAPV